MNPYSEYDTTVKQIRVLLSKIETHVKEHDRHAMPDDNDLVHVINCLRSLQKANRVMRYGLKSQLRRSVRSTPTVN